MVAMEGKVDHVLKYLKNIRAYSLSHDEPGCHSFKIHVSGNKILIFEKYVSAVGPSSYHGH